MTTIPAFQASGLASGLDTAKIVDSLVSIESTPLAAMAKQQAAIAVQISSIATLMGNLTALGTSAKSLGKDGVAVLGASGNFTDFSVSGSAANAGRYTIAVEHLARAAKVRSTAFATVDTVVTAVDSALQLKVNQVAYNIDIKAGASLADVATTINKAGAPFSASVISTGTQFFLSITNKNTGMVVGQPASTALEIVGDPGLGLSTPPGLEASNAVVWVDGLRVERTSNEIANVVPGATLSLKAATNVGQELIFTRDLEATGAKLQGFVDAYNKVVSFVSTNLNPAAGEATDGKLSGGTLLGLQRRLQTLLSTNVSSTGTVRTLRDLGVRLQKDGTAELDKSVLGTALTADPGAVNAVFSTASTGISALVAGIVDSHNNSTHGALVSRRTSLQTTTKRLDVRTEDFNRHLDAFRQQLVKQFTAMEAMVNSFQSVGKFLDSQDVQAQKR